MRAHHPAHLLNVRTQRLGEWPRRHANHGVWHVEALGQNVGGDQPVNLGVRLRKICDHVLLVLVIVLVRKADEVVARFSKLLGQIGAVRHASAKHNGLARPAKNLVRLLHPSGNNVARDLHATLGHFVLRPFAGHLLGAGHVDLFGDKHLERR